MLQAANILAQEPNSTNIDENIEKTNIPQENNSSVEATPYESRSTRDRTLIATVLPEESVWLDTEYGKILAMHRITEARSTYGVLLLLHAAEEPQHWPPTLENLRINLPRYGWETLAVTLPRKTPSPIPARPFLPSSSANSNSDNEESATPDNADNADNASVEAGVASSSSAIAITRNLLIAAYIEAARKYLDEKNLYNLVVLTDNSSAYDSLSIFLPDIKENSKDTDTIDGPLQALIIANLQPQETLSRTELESIFSISQLPVMDIFFAPHSSDQQTVRHQHKAVAMRQKINDYQQHNFAKQPAITETDYQSFLLGRVRGFMQKKASGIELQKTISENPINQTPIN